MPTSWSVQRSVPGEQSPLSRPSRLIEVESHPCQVVLLAPEVVGHFSELLLRLQCLDLQLLDDHGRALAGERLPPRGVLDATPCLSQLRLELQRLVSRECHLAGLSRCRQLGL